MKKYYLLSLCCLFSMPSILSAQEIGNKEIDTMWKDQINTVFQHLDLSKVPHGILSDYAMTFTDVAAYNGSLTDSTAVDVRVLSNILGYKNIFNQILR